MPVLAVSDVRAAAEFYARLGFECHGFWGGEPVDFAVTQRGDVTLGLDRSDGIPSDRHGWAVYVYVDDIAALHAELTAEGLSPTPLCEQPYGCREFEVTDLDGHTIAFGQDLAPEAYGPGLGPERGRG